MSKWTHAICDNCWSETEQALNGRQPVRVLNHDVVKCCFCGDDTKGGIFIRYAPEETLCKGKCEHG